nr:SCO family protein [Acuticoccus mangrovi]
MPDTPVVTQDGTELAFSEALGPGAYIIGFTYTKCPAICGATELDMQFVAASRADLDTPLRLVTLTLDPQNDTPQVLATAHSAAGAPPEWVRLTGRPSDIMRLLGYLGAWDGRPLKEHKQVFIVGNTSSGRNSRLSVEEVGYDPERLLAIAASYAAS